MLLQNVSLLTLGLVFSLSLQAQILITPDNSTTVEETADDTGGQIVLPPRGSVRPNPTPVNSTSAPKSVVTKTKKPLPAIVIPAKAQNNIQVVQPQNTAELVAPVSLEEKAPAPKKKSTRDSFVLGFDLRTYKYEEIDFVTHQGLMFGATAQYLSVFQSGELNLNTQVLYGQLTYSGSISSTSGTTTTTTPTEVTNVDFLNKTNALWQWTPLGPGSPFALKIGLGFRYLSDNYTDSGFYKRTGLWGYIPVGVGLRTHLNSDMQMNFDLTYQQIIYGGIDSKLTETGVTGLQDVYLKQTGHGLELEAGIVYAKAYHISAYFEGWYLDESDTVDVPPNSLGIDTVHEPANTAISYGIKLGYDLF